MRVVLACTGTCATAALGLHTAEILEGLQPVHEPGITLNTRLECEGLLLELLQAGSPESHELSLLFR